jgi:hypothetical protein
VERLPAERAATDGGPGLSSAAGREARKARIKTLGLERFDHLFHRVIEAILQLHIETVHSHLLIH